MLAFPGMDSEIPADKLQEVVKTALNAHFKDAKLDFQIGVLAGKITSALSGTMNIKNPPRHFTG